MATTSESLAFDRGVRPMLEIVLPEKAAAVIGFQADPELQARIVLRPKGVVQIMTDADDEASGSSFRSPSPDHPRPEQGRVQS